VEELRRPARPVLPPCRVPGRRRDGRRPGRRV